MKASRALLALLAVGSLALAACSSTAPGASPAAKPAAKSGASRAAGLLRRENAQDEIYEKIYVAILEHRLRPGTKLGEERLDRQGKRDGCRYELSEYQAVPEQASPKPRGNVWP